MPKKLERHPLPKRLKTLKEPANLSEEIYNRFMRRTQRLEIIEEHRKDYEKVGNPLSVFDAYLHARKAGTKLPDWILKGLDSIAWEALHPKPSKTRGGPSHYRQYRSYHIRKYAVDAVGRALDGDQDLTVDSACDKASVAVFDKWAEEVDPKTIRRWYYSRNSTATP